MMSNPTNPDANEKVDGIISEVLDGKSGSLLDRCADMADKVKELSLEEHTLFVKKTEKLYDSEPYFALLFTRYGRIKEHSPRIGQQLDSNNENLKIDAMLAIRELELQEYYPRLMIRLTRRLGPCRGEYNNLDWQTLITAFKLNPDENLERLISYVSSANINNARSTMQNILYDLVEKQDHERIHSFLEILESQRTDGFQLFSNSYRDALEIASY